jgi:hypothetical protein
MEGKRARNIGLQLVINNVSVETRRRLSSNTRTGFDSFILSQASPYRTVGEFFANNSVARAYVKITDKPAPRRITVRFDALAVVLKTERQKSALLIA